MTITTPLLWVICHPVAKIDIAYSCMKFDDFRFSRSSDMIGVTKFCNGSHELTSLSSVGCDLHIQPEHQMCSPCDHQLRRCIRQCTMLKLRWFNVLKGHPRSSATFDKAHTTSYSSLIETMRLSRTVFEILSLIFQKLKRSRDTDHAPFRETLS